MRKLSLVLLISLCSYVAPAQPLFPDRCAGRWEGTMRIYQRGLLRDSVRVLFTAARTSDSSWQWKMEYLSPTRPAVKDYVLRRVSDTKFVTDEGGGIVLDEFVFDNKMYCLFRTSGVTLTANYELIDPNSLLFEVTSASGPAPSGNNVENFQVTSVQKVLLKRVKP